MPARLARHETLAAWLPVVVLPWVLVADAALSAGSPPVSPLGVLAAMVACLPLVLRRRISVILLYPLLTGGIVLALALLEPGNTVVLIPMVALYELARGGERRRSLWMGLAVVPCVVLSILPFAHGSSELVQLVIRNLALSLLALAAGDVVRHRREAVQRLVAAKEEEARAELGAERLRIAREVHDVVAHAMVAINVQAGVAAHLLDPGATQARDALRDIKRASGDALTDLRSTLGVLRDESGSAPVAPAAGLGDLDGLAGGLRSAGVAVAMEVDPLADVPAPVHAAGYRIVQEALTNVLRHADASTASVAVSRDNGAVHIAVANDGARADPGADGPGNGLRGMRERARALGGTLDCGPQPGGRWRVDARLPVA